MGVVVRECDMPLAKEAITHAQQMLDGKRQENKSKACALTLDTEHFLPPPPKPGSDASSCLGGVLLSSKDSKIQCSQTIDDRLAISFQANLPSIRAQIFPEAAKMK